MLRLACTALFLLAFGANAQADTVTVRAPRVGKDWKAACKPPRVMTGFTMSVGSDCSGTCGPGQHSVGGFTFDCSNTGPRGDK